MPATSSYQDSLSTVQMHASGSSGISPYTTASTADSTVTQGKRCNYIVFYYSNIYFSMITFSVSVGVYKVLRHMKY